MIKRMADVPHQREVKARQHPASARALDWWVAIALTIVTLAVYARTLGCGFVLFDDNEYVTTNQRVLNGLALDNIRWAFTTFTIANWHPLTWLTHMIDVEVWGTRAAGHHLTNVVLHAANTVLLFILLRKMTGSLWRSALVAALFAVHPLHVESVAWVAERKDVLSTLFGLLAMIAYVKYVGQPTYWRYAAVACAFALSLMSKPMLVTLPFVLLLLDWWPLKRLAILNGASLGRVLIEKIPLLALSVASSVITVIAQKAGGAVVPVEAMTFGQRIINAIVTYAAYLWKTVWPIDLAVFYPMKPEVPAAAVVGSALILLVITAIAGVLGRKRPALLVGWLWYLGTLVPVIGLVQVGFQSMADRYTYVPLIGIFLMIAWAIPDVNPRAARLAATASALVLMGLAIRTWHQIGYWRDTYTLTSHAIKVTDNNFIAHTILGYAHSRDGNLPEAERQYRLAVNINPRYGVARDNLGSALHSQRKLDEAVVHLREAARLQPRAATTRNNLGAALMDSSDLDGATDEFLAAIDLDPRLASARLNLGRALAAKQRFSQAIEHYQLALDQQPNWPDALVHLGIAQASIGKLDGAIANFQRAIELKPDHALARQCLDLAQQQRHQQPQTPEN